jgi:Nif-specific regulatory protein
VPDAADLADDLRAAFGLSAATSTIAAPVTHSRLLELIVQTATHVIGARAGSLLLVDEQTQELVFEVSAVDEITRLQKVRVPLGEGIAGLVALTGQPMAVTDAQNDPRHARDIAEQIGYRPSSLVCVPLQFEDQVIGVIELLDKQGAAGFDSSDIMALGLFANQAAVAIEQSRAQRSIANLMRELLGSGHERANLLERVGAFADDLEADSMFQRSLELARLVHEIAQYGENESTACLAILRGFAEYLRTRG